MRIEWLPGILADNSTTAPRRHPAFGIDKCDQLKGIATVELADGRIVRAELHWYEAHGVGRREMKLKQIIDES